jgi:GT2 family glycosyltransferase
MIGVVIINFGNPERTIRFVREECGKIGVPHQVVIVDNGSGADAVEILKKELEGIVTILPANKNLGFAKANNLGAEYAIKQGADLLLFVNNDIVFTDADVVDRMAAKLADLPSTGIIGPKVVGLDGRLQSPSPKQSFAQRNLLPYWGKLVYGQRKLREKMQSDYAETASEGPCFVVSGCCFMVKAESFTGVGMFDPATFLYAEEMILSARMAGVGLGAYYYPEVAVLHEHGATTRKYYDRKRIRRMKFESESYYYRSYEKTPSWEISLGRFTLWLKGLLGR